METKSKDQKETATKTDNSKLREFFVDQLKDIYWAEKALYEALPKLAKASTSKKLASFTIIAEDKVNESAAKE